METKICSQCKKKCREVDARCKECGYRFMMLCEGCGRDVKGFTLCKECRQQGYKRAPFEKDSTPFSGDEWLDYENEDMDDFGPKRKSHLRHFDWDCYDQYKRLQKLNKNMGKKKKK